MKSIEEVFLQVSGNNTFFKLLFEEGKLIKKNKESLTDACSGRAIFNKPVLYKFKMAALCTADCFERQQSIDNFKRKGFEYFLIRLILGAKMGL